VSRGPSTVGELKAALSDPPDHYVLVFNCDEMDCNEALVDLEIMEGTTSDEPGSVAFNISDP
jgi:hypothetical protein